MCDDNFCLVPLLYSELTLDFMYYYYYPTLEMPSYLVRGRATKILVLNPNSSEAMTDGLRPAINDVDLSYSTEIHTYTAPSPSPASINTDADLAKSTTIVLADLSALSPYDGILIACYSAHPLVPALQSSLSPSFSSSTIAITGIFEASVLAALSLLGPGEKWGIVTTGTFWESHLSAGVHAFLNSSPPFPPSSSPPSSSPPSSPSPSSSPDNKFAGVVSTGLNASDFHRGVDAAEVEARLRRATRELLRRGGGETTTCIVMGCAGMAGLEGIIRDAAREERGERFAYATLHVVDGVRAGLMQLENMIKLQRLRPGVK
ncbi:hypothetical protein F4775DRAFT_317269 [Biscogniauxia sp. FL1348]|nr:hypothetical protein F4775DRAFT_317269 [Biscogniauxia sp. FL1348]